MGERTYKILEAVIDEYIRTGEPVGSKFLSEKLDLKVSPATIRNEMASLEQQGYLEHTHTSSGRVPTFKGYRLYIERLTPESSLSSEEKLIIDNMFENMDGSSDETIVENATHALAELTKCAIVSTSATNQFSVITKVDVIPTGKRMYVLLLITSSGNMKNRICRLQFDLTNEQMEFFTRFVNENLKGVNLQNVSEEFIRSLSSALGGYMLTLSPLLQAVAELSADMLRERVSFDGEANLVAFDEFQKQEIATILESKNQFTELLNTAFNGINVVFGSEKDSFVVTNSSLITGTFNKGENKAGSFGVIGPMRLDYKKIIPYIEYFTGKVTNLLSNENGEEDEELKRIERQAHNIE